MTLLQFNAYVRKFTSFINTYIDKKEKNFKKLVVMPMINSPTLQKLNGSPTTFFGLPYYGPGIILPSYWIDDHLLYNSWIPKDAKHYSHNMNDIQIRNESSMSMGTFMHPFMQYIIEETIGNSALIFPPNNPICISDFKILMYDPYEYDYQNLERIESVALLDFITNVGLESSDASEAKRGYKRPAYINRTTIATDFVIYVWDEKKKKIAALCTFNFQDLHVERAEKSKGVHLEALFTGEVAIKTTSSKFKCTPKSLYLAHLHTLEEYESSNLTKMLKIDNYDVDLERKDVEKMGMASLLTYVVFRCAAKLQDYIEVDAVKVLTYSVGTKSIVSKYGLHPTGFYEKRKNTKNGIGFEVIQREDHYDYLKNMETEEKNLVQTYSKSHPQRANLVMNFLFKKQEYFQISRELFETVAYIQNVGYDQATEVREYSALNLEKRVSLFNSVIDTLEELKNDVKNFGFSNKLEEYYSYLIDSYEHLASMLLTHYINLRGDVLKRNVYFIYLNLNMSKQKFYTEIRKNANIIAGCHAFIQKPTVEITEKKSKRSLAQITDREEPPQSKYQKVTTKIGVNGSSHKPNVIKPVQKKHKYEEFSESDDS